MGAGLFVTPQAAAIFLNCHACAADLALTAFAAQLRDEFENLANAGGTDRVALGFQAARGIDRDASAQGRSARFSERTAIADGAEAEILRLQNFAHGAGIV